MAVDFATFLSVVPHILDAKLPVLLRGRHGVGKSEVVYQTAAVRGLPVVERRASQMTEGDLLGLPDTADTDIDGRKATTWNAPDWLVTACTQPVVLFLDEVDRATMEVRQGLFELTDSRKINGWHLHADTLIIAAVNGGEHGAQYQVGEMDPAELGYVFGNEGQSSALNQGGPAQRIEYSKEKGLRPLLRALESWINRWIIGPIAPHLELSFVGLDTESEGQRLDAISKKVNSYTIFYKYSKSSRSISC